MTRAFGNLALLGTAVLLACEAEPAVAPAAGERSPNAKLQPAPLAPPKEIKAELGGAGAPSQLDPSDSLAAREPQAIREDRAIPPAALTATAATTTPVAPADLDALELRARFQWFDLPPSGGLREPQRTALERMAKRAAPTMTISLTRTGQMRMRFDSVGFMFPDQSEIQAREDLLGHLLLWPKGRSYRTLPPGSLRAVFLERRVDVSPLITPSVRRVGQGRMLDQPTQLVEVGTSHGKLTLALATRPGFESSASLLCRFLTELIAAEPENSGCESGKLPLRGDYVWENGRQFGFLVDSLQQRTDATTTPLQLPPGDAQFMLGEWPAQEPVFADSETLGQLRLSPPAAAKEGSPEEGLSLLNNTELLRYALVDGVPVAWLLPGASLRIEVPKGRYQLAFRDFLGQDPLPPRGVSAPGKLITVVEVVKTTAAEE